MIQFIGLMIGFYILVRMIEIKSTGITNTVKGFAVAGIFITVFFMLMIIASGSEMMKYLQ